MFIQKNGTIDWVGLGDVWGENNVFDNTLSCLSKSN